MSAQAAIDRLWSCPEDDRRALASVYVEEQCRVMWRRFDLAVLVLLVSVGVAVIYEHRLHPQRAAATMWIFGAMVGVCLVAVLVARVARFQRHVATIAVTATLAANYLLCLYGAAAQASAERLALQQVGHLTGIALLMPWGWPWQLAAGGGILANFALVAPGLTSDPDSLLYTFLCLAPIDAVAVAAVYFLDRYRFEAFARTALQTREAEISAALIRVAHTLHTHLQAPDLLERVSDLAVDLLGCEWSATYLWDDQRQVFRLVALTGTATEEERTMWRQVEFARDSLPLLQAFRRGEVIEIPQPDNQPWVPAELLRRFGISSALYTPIFGTSDVIAVLIIGYGTRTGHFSEREKRLARGMADTTAVALENARLVADLRAASTLKSEFVATMSHELRTPINIIFGYGEMLAEGSLGTLTEMQLDTVQRVRRSTRELLDLVSATLDLGRLEAGREAVVRAPVTIDESFRVLAGEVEGLVAPEVALRWHVEDPPLAVITDGVKLKTILKNLIGNAIKFTSAGEIGVTARCNAGRLEVVVRDTGIGIPAEHVPAIFDMFRQIGSSGQRGSGGVGLGLHIVKRLAELLGGSIAVESALGVGSTFTLTLSAERLREPAVVNA